jgi:threonine synthase
MSFLNLGENRPLTILVATSGDTGGAVADGFAGVEGISVYILYPSGGVSDLQEKQLTTHGGNIHALEIEGTFDDCQRLVKSAFLDPELSMKYRLTSANSINIARLIPQTVYYFTSQAMLPADAGQPVFVVPSGNFGNLTAGLFARRMGLPVRSFVAATNVNDTVPQYLSGKGFHPRQSLATISNAMDVGNPSNFGRMLDLFEHSHDAMKNEIAAYVISDAETREMMKQIYNTFQYIADPHGAVALAAWQYHRRVHANNTGIILETAHPAKFIETVESTLKIRLPLPAVLEAVSKKIKQSDILNAEFKTLKSFLLDRT